VKLTPVLAVFTFLTSARGELCYFMIASHTTVRRDRLALRRITVCFVGLLVVQLIISVLSKLVPGFPNTYPVDRWSLFSQVPNQMRDHSLWVVTPGGQGWYEQGWGTPHDVHAAYSTFHALGLASGEGDSPRTEHLLELVSSNFVQWNHVSHVYLIERQWRPKDRWNSGRFISTKVIREIHSPVEGALSKGSESQ